MKLMIVLCLVLGVVGRGLERKLLEEIRGIRRRVDKLSDTVLNLKETCENIENMAQCTKKQEPRSCLEWLAEGFNESGTYKIYLHKGTEPIKVFCDQTTDGGGWIVFQRREDGTEDFYRNWRDYKLGFGNTWGEFWLGLEKIHRLTVSGSYTLRIDLEDFDNNTRYAMYNNFKIGPKSGNYVLKAEGYSGTAGDALAERHNGIPFSTFDKENDVWIASCAHHFKGGWWYKDCHRANLNALYHGGPHESYADGINWWQWKGFYYSLRFTEMKFRERV